MKIENKIIYEDEYILIYNKPSGIASQGDKGENLKDILLNKYDFLEVVNRLDKPVGGLIIFAKTKEALIKLNDMVKNREISKFYYVVVYGDLLDKEGIFEDYLIKLKTSNLSKISSKDKKNSKIAKLKYRLVDKTLDEFNNKISLIDVELLTGRHHQIRVQFSSRGFYILGDKKYKNNRIRGEKYNNIALFSYKLEFKHPITNDDMKFKIVPNKSGVFKYFNI